MAIGVFLDWINMHYKRFGRTNRLISVFSVGTMRCLRSEEMAIATVREAVRQGINHIETARGYGRSEVYLGKALQAGLPLPRRQLFVTTKIPPLESADQMERYIDESLQRLQLDFIDGLAVHGINTWDHLDRVLAADGCRRGWERALADGRVRHVGFSTHAPLEIVQQSILSNLFDFVNLHYYYFYQRLHKAVDLAWEQDMGVFIISPADKGGQLFAPPAKLQQLCQPFTPLELTYRFLLSDRRVTTLSVGPANPEQLQEAVRLGDRSESLTAQEAATLQKLKSTADAALGSDKCSQCYQCLPCPEEINIPEVLRLRNLAVAYDMSEFGKYRYRMFENAGHWFPGRKGNRCTECGDCLPRCPENLDIPKLLGDTHERLKGREGRRLWEF
jgi:hypothetical protein